MSNQFKGTGVAIITPFHKHGTIDFSAMERLINHVIDNKVEYIVLMGTTGETVTLSKDEKNALLGFTIETISHRVPLVVGIGGNNTMEIVDTIKSVNFEDIDAILSVSPYYNKPQQQGIYYHFKHIATASPVPVIIYNVPGRTGSNISAQTTLQLANDFSNIIGVKEASGNLQQCMQIIKNKPKGFLVISGDDNMTLPLLSLGADGVISVVANAFPHEFSEMVRLGLRGDFSKARTWHYRLCDFVDTLFADGSPSGVKAALEILELAPNNVRLPLVKVNKDIYNRLATQIRTIKGS